MMDFSSMSVHSLVGGLVNAGRHGVDENAPEIVLMESALRSAVIREASMGVIAVPRYGDGNITIDIDEEDTVPATENSIEGRHRALVESIKKKVPEGKYDLIPHKETP
jgi:hypothetical protein